MSSEEIYPTDELGVLEKSIEHRTPMYTETTAQDWVTADPIYSEKDGEEILRVGDFEVMGGFQAPYMIEIVKAVIEGNKGDFVNIGYGLGIVDRELQRHEQVEDHHIVELNENIADRAAEWAKTQDRASAIHIHTGDWRDVLPELGVVFDGVIYDGYPLRPEELCRDSVEFLGKILGGRLVRETTGKISFYLDSVSGMGEKFKEFLRSLGVNGIEQEKIDITLPEREMKHWETPHFWVPKISNIKY